VISYQCYRVCNAAVEPLGGSEKKLGDEVIAAASHKIRLHYFDGVNVTDRISFGDSTVEINAIVNHKNKNEMLVLYCKEAVH
jgi:head-tail adaptor